MRSIRQKERYNASGFTLIEVLIASALFGIIGYSVFLAYSNVLQAISRSQVRNDELSIIRGEIETVRNMQYSDVGIIGGYPTGKLVASSTVVFSGNTYAIDRTVRNVDDPFDGLAPADTAPADYKLVQWTVSCVTCGSGFAPVSMTTTVAPKGLENSTNNGSLFINVFDASGAPVINANVHVTNTLLNPSITIDDVTNNSGVLQLVDIPPSVNGYNIVVTKPGYSTDQTYPATQQNKNPVKPSATVAAQQVTSVSFAIDKVGAFNFSAADTQCNPVANFPFTLTGGKLIGASPDILKYGPYTFTTDASGLKFIGNLEWDTYTLASASSTTEFTGSSPASPFVLNPGAMMNVQLLFEPKVSRSLLTTVVDDTGNAVNGAVVELAKSGSYDQTLITGQRTVGDTDWGGGSFSSQSGGVSYASPTTELGVQSPGNGATSTEWLISRTFDMGTSDIVYNTLRFTENIQPAHSSPDAIRVQLATNNDNATWNFVGPDGTANSYYTTSGAQIAAAASGNRYLRYKVIFYLDGTTTILSFFDISIDFTSHCTPSGQVLFNNLGPGNYSITVNKSGFQTYTDSGISINGDWQQYKAQLAR